MKVDYLWSVKQAGLDDKTKAKTMQYVVDNTKNKTVIIVTHDIDEADSLGGEIITMGHLDSVSHNNYNTSIDG